MKDVYFFKGKHFGWGELSSVGKNKTKYVMKKIDKVCNINRETLKKENWDGLRYPSKRVDRLFVGNKMLKNKHEIFDWIADED